MSSYQSLIAARTLADKLDDPAVRIVDCRFSLFQPDQGLADYAAGHIPGASYANLDTDLAAPISRESGRHPLPDVELFVATVKSWGISNDSQVVVYDDAGGGVAARLWWMLRWLGHRNVAVLDGGFAAWSRGCYRVSEGTTRPPEGFFVGNAAKDSIWTTADIESWLATGKSFLLVDARDEARFNGEHEPIDPIAGHVPGAVNLPFTDTLNSEGTWRSRSEIEASWGDIAGSLPKDGWGVMCGSGVTACHLALSAFIAGLPEPRLYVGSWSEWVRDSKRPIGVAASDPSES